MKHEEQDVYKQAWLCLRMGLTMTSQKTFNVQELLSLMDYALLLAEGDPLANFMKSLAKEVKR